MIFDESLITTRAVTVSIRELKPVVAALEVCAPFPGLPPLFEPVAHLKETLGLLENAVGRARFAGGPQLLILPQVDQERVGRWLRAMKHMNSQKLFPVRLHAAIDLLEASGEQVRVTANEDGALTCHRVVVPESFQNILVFDASYPIRKLCQMDPELHNAEDVLRSFRELKPSKLKRWDSVTVHHMRAGGGRQTVTRQFDGPRRKRVISDAVADVLEYAEGPYLIVSYTKRSGQPDPERALKRDLVERGIDLNQTMIVDGEEVQRYEFTTWGHHDSTNDLRHCRTVICAGVMLRDLGELHGAALGQLRDLTVDFTREGLVDLRDSEAAHNVYQAASRGRCRLWDGDQASGMDVFVIHKSPGIRKYLERAMPGVRIEEWARPERKPKPTLKELAASRIAGMLAFRDHRISSIKLKREDKGEGMRLRDLRPSTYTDAVSLALESLQETWSRDGRTLVPERSLEERVSRMQTGGAG